MLDRTPKPSPEEKKRIERLMRSVQRVEALRNPTEGQRFMSRHQVRHILKSLGESDPGLKLRKDAFSIIIDGWPFKLYRLRKLIKNGRRG